MHWHFFLLQRLIGWGILIYGGLDYYNHELRDPKKLMRFCFIVNIILHLPSMIIVQKRHGVDHTAYLNQAGQVVQGQRNYELFNTNQGPCFYPAGHLWLYYYPYLFFSKCADAEHYWKLMHYVIHSLTNYLVSQIGYSYFRDKPKVA